MSFLFWKLSYFRSNHLLIFSPSLGLYFLPVYGMSFCFVYDYLCCAKVYDKTILFIKTLNVQTTHIIKKVLSIIILLKCTLIILHLLLAI